MIHDFEDSTEMNFLKTSIEFHDSELSACLVHDDRLVIELRPAYVHKWEMINGKWFGKGCVQDVMIEINKAKVVKKMPAVPIEISDGTISAGETVYNNLIPVPFNMNRPCHLNLFLINGDSLEVLGDAINIELQGEAKFVEKLPDEWLPNSSE